MIAELQAEFGLEVRGAECGDQPQFITRPGVGQEIPQPAVSRLRYFLSYTPRLACTLCQPAFPATGGQACSPTTSLPAADGQTKPLLAQAYTGANTGVEGGVLPTVQCGKAPLLQCSLAPSQTTSRFWFWCCNHQRTMLLIFFTD